MYASWQWSSNKWQLPFTLKLFDSLAAFLFSFEISANVESSQSLQKKRRDIERELAELHLLSVDVINCIAVTEFEWMNLTSL